MRINITELLERLAVAAGKPVAAPVLSPAEIDFLIDCVHEVTKPTDGGAAYLDPGYDLARIDTIWAFITTDERGEGIAAGPMGNLPVVPLIGADMNRVNSLRPLAQHVANAFGRPVTLAKFSVRENLETLEPKSE